MLGFAAPAEGQDAVDVLLNGVDGAVANHGEVGDQTDVPENGGYAQIGGKREYVPQQRGVEVHPQGTKLVGDGQHKVRNPNTTHVDHGEQSRLDYGENGHGLRGAVDGHAPLLTEQQQYRRNQGSCVANAHPPYEVGDVPSPADGLVQSPGSDTVGNGPEYGAHAPEKQGQGNAKSNPPGLWGRGLNGANDVQRDVVVRLIS